MHPASGIRNARSASCARVRSGTGDTIQREQSVSMSRGSLCPEFKLGNRAFSAGPAFSPAPAKVQGEYRDGAVLHELRRVAVRLILTHCGCLMGVTANLRI